MPIFALIVITNIYDLSSCMQKLLQCHILVHFLCCSDDIFILFGVNITKGSSFFIMHLCVCGNILKMVVSIATTFYVFVMKILIENMSTLHKKLVKEDFSHLPNSAKLNCISVNIHPRGLEIP